MLRTSIKQDTVARSRAAAAGFTSTLRSCDPLTAKIGVPCGWDHLHAWPPTCPPKAPMRPSLREIPSDPCCQAQEHRRSDFALKPTATTAMAHFSRGCGLCATHQWIVGLGWCWRGCQNRSGCQDRQSQDAHWSLLWDWPIKTGAEFNYLLRASKAKTPGSFLPGVLLESCQTIGIRSYAERER
jgi:hypothetical protein